MSYGWLAWLAAASLGTSIACAQSPTPAPSPWTGFYVGGGGSYSTVSVETSGDCYDGCYWWGDYNSYDQGDGAYGYSLHAGWRVHQFVAVEASYLDTGKIGWHENLVYMPELKDYYNNRVDFSAQVAEVSVLGILPFANSWEAYLRLGAGFWDGQSEQRLEQSFGNAVVTGEVDDQGTGLLIGIGLGVTLAKAWHLRLDYQTVGIDEDVLNAQRDTTLDSLLFELQYRFGAQ
jgi:hypothetical protein